MRWKVSWLVMLFCCVVLGLLMAGCQMPLAGGRAVLVLPFARSPVVLDSQGTQTVHDADHLGPGSGTDAATVANPDGSKVASAGGFMIQVTGNDARNARSTDTGLADQQSTVAGRETGSVDASGPRKLDKALSIPINAAPGAGVTVPGVGGVPAAGGEDGAAVEPRLPDRIQLEISEEDLEEIANRASRKVLQAYDTVSLGRASP